MAGSFSNETILEQLRHGIAKFELSSSPVPSVSGHCRRSPPPFASLTNASTRFFARIGRRVDGGSPAMKKVERYSVQKVTGDGRCLFRALVKGMAYNKGMRLGPREERESAGSSMRLRYLHFSDIVHHEMEIYDDLMTDELRMAVKEVICDNEKERHQYEEALVAITVEESLRRYCERIGRPDFWGGEAELLVLSKLCSQPIVVYIPEHENGGWGSGFIPIQEYGAEFHKGSKKGKPPKAVRLLYTGRNHYDLLI